MYVTISRVKLSANVSQRYAVPIGIGLTIIALGLLAEPCEEGLAASGVSGNDKAVLMGLLWQMFYLSRCGEYSG